MQSAAVRGQGSVNARQVVSWMALLMTAAVLQACGGAWTARVCSSNASGNCNGVSPIAKHYQAKSTLGFTDVKVQDPDCSNGFGQVEVTVLDRDNLDVAVYCLSDRPGNGAPGSEGIITLPPTPDASPPPEPSQP